MLRVEGVHAAYGRIEILRGVDLAVPDGIVALLGANGAGKTTLLKVISGQLRPTAGRILVRGRPFPRASAADLTSAGVCLVPEGRGVFANLTVDENLVLASYFGVPVDEVKDQVYSLFPILAERRRQRAGSLSGGEQQMLALGRALASRPRVLLLDELSMGLAPKIVDELYGVVAAAAAGGMAILVVEQFARRALEVARTAVVMHAGRVVAEGAPDDIRHHLEELYLGGAA